mgnify:FL=1
MDASILLSLEEVYKEGGSVWDLGWSGVEGNALPTLKLSPLLNLALNT